MTKTEIINETIAFYSTHPRSIKKNTQSSLESYSGCAYKGDNGAECAFQRCVKDNLSEFEGKNCRGIMATRKVEFKEGYEGHDVSFWEDVQLIHDRLMDSSGIRYDCKQDIDELLEKYAGK